MRGIKKIVTLFIVSLFAVMSSQVVLADGTKTEVELNKSELTEEIPVKKDTVYTTKNPTPVKLLPQTGEIVTSFIYIIIGLSLLIFVIGLLVNKLNLNSVDVRWDY